MPHTHTLKRAHPQAASGFHSIELARLVVGLSGSCAIQMLRDNKKTLLAKWARVTETATNAAKEYHRENAVIPP